MENLQGGVLALEHRYHIHQREGHFGFVTLYRGVQEPFDRPVWISVFAPLLEAGAEASLFATIKAGAHKSSALEGPGVLRTIDYGELEHNVPFVIWERAGDPERSPSLGDLLAQRGTLSLQTVSTLITRLANVVDRAHGADLVHGNLSPRWIFLPDGDPAQAMIGHFALGLTVREMLAMPEAVLAPEAIAALGPEMFASQALRQQESGERDASSGPRFTRAGDIYALGALAYTCLVGVHPYFDDDLDASEGMLRIKSEEAPRLAELGVDEAVSDVVERALSRDPARRWTSAAAFADALEAACTPDASASRPRAGRRAAATTASPELHASSASEPDSPDSIDAPPPSPDAARSQRQERSTTQTAPGGYVLTAVVLALLVSNLSWFFVYVSGHGAADAPTPEANAEENRVEENSEPLTTRVLPGGLQIHSEPADAQLYLLDGESATLLGTTPLTIDTALRSRDRTELELRKPGYNDIRVKLHRSAAGEDILLHLIPQKHR